MAERGTQLKIMGVLLAASGSSSPPRRRHRTPGRSRPAPLARPPHRRRPARRSPPGPASRARTRARPPATAGTDALDGGSHGRARRVARRHAPGRRPRRRATPGRRRPTAPRRRRAPRSPHRPSIDQHRRHRRRAVRRSGTAATSPGNRTRRPRTSRTSPTRGASTALRDRPTTTASRARSCRWIPPARRRRPPGAKPPDPPKPEGLPTRRRRWRSCSHRQDNYFGVSTPQAPFDWKDFQIFSAAARKLPNMVEFFSGLGPRVPARPGDRDLAARRAAGPLVGAAADRAADGPRQRQHRRSPATRWRRSSTAATTSTSTAFATGRARPRPAGGDPVRPRDERQLVPVVGGDATGTRRASTSRRGATCTTGSPPSARRTRSGSGART